MRMAVASSLRDSDPLLELVAQEALRTHQQHRDDDEEGQGVLELDGDVRAAQAFGDPEEQTAEDGPRQAVEPTQEGGGEPLEEGIEHEVGVEEERGREQ